jgi:hypothetical protein
MILEYSIGNIKNIYDEDIHNEDIRNEDLHHIDDIYEYNDDIEHIEQIVSDKIDELNINSSILHVFPITISLSFIVLISSYIIL